MMVRSMICRVVHAVWASNASVLCLLRSDIGSLGSGFFAAFGEPGRCHDEIGAKASPKLLEGPEANRRHSAQPAADPIAAMG
jgi:hypothetical protein